LGYWSNAVAYNVNDVVIDTIDKNTYISIQAGTDHQPSTSASYWLALVNAGPTGVSIVLTENFALVGNGDAASNRIIYSYDGLVWQPSTSGNTIYTAGGRVDFFIWNGAVWLAAGISGTSEGNHARLATSPDGINWTLVTAFNAGPANTNFYGGAWNGSKWIVLYNNTTSVEPFYSYDTITWTSFSANISCIAASPALWVGGGRGAQPGISYSTNGITWVESASATSIVGGGDVYGIGYNGVLWVASGISYNGTTHPFFMYSPDAITWTESNSITALASGAGYANPVWNGSIWVAGCTGDNFILYSYNAITWYAAPSAATYIRYVYGLAWNGSLFICTAAPAYGGSTSTVITSPDGINWSSSSASSLITSTTIGVASRRVLPYVGYSYGAGGGGPTGYTGNTGDTGPTGNTGPTGPIPSDYTPTTAGDWTGTAPTTIQQALDRLAAGLVALSLYP
jgi:hypothetical protein